MAAGRVPCCADKRELKRRPGSGEEIVVILFLSGASVWQEGSPRNGSGMTGSGN